MWPRSDGPGGGTLGSSGAGGGVGSVLSLGRGSRFGPRGRGGSCGSPVPWPRKPGLRFQPPGCGFDTSAFASLRRDRSRGRSRQGRSVPAPRAAGGRSCQLSRPAGRGGGPPRWSCGRSRQLSRPAGRGGAPPRLSCGRSCQLSRPSGRGGRRTSSRRGSPCGRSRGGAFFLSQRSFRSAAFFCLFASTNFWRGSRCSPPGRQSRPRFSPAGGPEGPPLRSSLGGPEGPPVRSPLGGPGGPPVRSPLGGPGGPPLQSRAGGRASLNGLRPRPSSRRIRAASGESHSLPRANHFISASGCFSRIR